MHVIFEAPLNQLSFGNVAFNFLKEFYALQQKDRSLTVSYFPIANADVSAFNTTDASFNEWLKQSVENRFKNLRKDAITLKLWHINGAEKRLTAKQVLFSFYELDQPTVAENAIVGLQDATIFSSSYARDTFLGNGCSNVYSAPLGFDSSFFKTSKKYLEGKVHFLLMGKFEKRKHSDKIIKLWAKKYGNNPKFQLSCSVTNPFLDKDLMKRITAGYKGLASNINFLPYVNTNAEVNDIVNSADIDLSGLSGAEGWGLPAFNATCLGKWSVVLNATSHKDWATENNSILVQPSGKIEAYDGVFFKKGSDFNQGNIFDFNEDAAVSAMERATELVLGGKKNEEGASLGQKFTYANTVSHIRDILSKV